MNNKVNIDFNSRAIDVINQLSALFRTVRLHDINNSAVSSSIGKLMSVINELIDLDNEMTLELRGDYFYLNDNRIKYEIKYLSNFNNLAGDFKKLDLGSITVFNKIANAEVRQLVETITGPSSSDDPFSLLVDKMSSVDCIRLEKIKVFANDESLDIRKTVKKNYFRAVSFTKEVMKQIKMGEKVNIKKSKRMMASLVDNIIEQEQIILGMTAMKDYDEYTFRHSLNVSILSAALGLQLGFNRKKLVDLGIVALFHDIGKMKVSDEILNKPTNLNDDEWKIIKMHPVWGISSVLKMRGLDDLTMRTAIAAFEHHMHYNLQGYPKLRVPLNQELFSRIISIADQYDAITSSRVYSRQAMAPDEALRVMMEGSGSTLDPLLLKYFINIVGVYPVGTVVMLDTNELGLVFENNKQSLTRPRVMIITDSKGDSIEEYVVSLMDRNAEGEFERSIIKTVDAGKYRINLAEYML